MPESQNSQGITFIPPLANGSVEYKRAIELLQDMNIVSRTVFYTVGFGSLKYLGFERKQQAIMFKLRF